MRWSISTTRIDILIHLIVGSEGTLGFVSEVTYRTIPEHPYKATGLVAFPDPHSCARAISQLGQWRRAVDHRRHRRRVYRAAGAGRRSSTCRPSRRYVPVLHRHFAGRADRRHRARRRRRSRPKSPRPSRSSRAEGATHIDFSTDEARSHALWDIRKGFFASGGAARPKGTSMLTEDVAAPIDRLADFVIDMRKLLDEHGYEDAIIFGHALAGNLHFQMSDDFMRARRGREVRPLLQGAQPSWSRSATAASLKAEHGTGRAIAPFVEAEWGTKAYRAHAADQARCSIPRACSIPGVLLNPDAEVHVKNLKLMPLADESSTSASNAASASRPAPATS